MVGCCIWSMCVVLYRRPITPALVRGRTVHAKPVQCFAGVDDGFTQPKLTTSASNRITFQHCFTYGLHRRIVAFASGNPFARSRSILARACGQAGVYKQWSAPSGFTTNNVFVILSLSTNRRRLLRLARRQVSGKATGPLPRNLTTSASPTA
jgi:hypothetical protein